EGRITYLAAAMPSASGKTNLSMVVSSLPGWRAWTVGDDIAWIHVDQNGQLRAINPERGFFGVAPNTSPKTNANATQMVPSTKVVPLVFEAFDWTHGVFLGSAMSTETTAAITGQVGVVRRDPMAMLPFCGYNMADYFAHWLQTGSRVAKPPTIFRVNWFRKDD